MSFALVGDLFGGIGLFLLGMYLMTNGMKQAAGQGLKSALQAATYSPARGLVSGILITSLVQSSSAVTVATIGFVNAGLLKLRQAINVIYGCNIGTTMTGWLVALVGFKIEISLFALPLVGLGMLLKLIGGERRLSHIGIALAGFGLFFIGLDYLKEAFEGLETLIPLDEIPDSGIGLVFFVLAGFILTFLMQSSSAAMAITLSLMASGSIPLASAGALVIGANMGTTSTAVLSVIGATSNAKRIAGVHVIFNFITGIVGVVLLEVLAQSINHLHDLDLVTALAAFHTLFNIVGVIIVLPITSKLEAFLSKRFLSQEEKLGCPRFLDKTILESPALAIEAIKNELTRVHKITSDIARAAISSEAAEMPKFKAQIVGVQQLNESIALYNQKVAQRNLTEEISMILPTVVRITRYQSEIARLSALLPIYYDILDKIADHGLKLAFYTYQSLVVDLIDSCEIDEAVKTSTNDSRHVFKKLKKQYQFFKNQVIESSIIGKLRPDDSIRLLDALSHIHRLAEQIEKSARYWSGISPIHSREDVLDEEQAEITC